MIKTVVLYVTFVVMCAVLTLFLIDARKRVNIPITNIDGTELELLVEEREFSDLSWRSFTRDYPDCAVYGYHVHRLGLRSMHPATSRRFKVLLARSDACGNQ